MEKRVISTQVQDEDIKIEKNLRPQTLDDYIGQQKAKKNLKVYIEAAKQRGESLDHVLFFGPPGLGEYPISNRDHVTVSITNMGQRKLMVEAVSKVTLDIPCARCLETVKSDIEIEISKDIDMSESGAERLEECLPKLSWNFLEKSLSTLFHIVIRVLLGVISSLNSSLIIYIPHSL